MRPGVASLMGGLLLCGVASLVSWVSYDSAEPGDTFTVWSGGIAAGGLMALFGALRFGMHLWEAFTDRRGRARKFLLQTILYACTYVATAEGSLNPRLARVSRIVEQLTGYAPDSAELLRIAITSYGSTFGASAEFTGRLFLLEPQHRELTLYSAVLTAYADGVYGSEESKRLEEIATRLDIPSGSLHQMKKRVHSAAPATPATGARVMSSTPPFGDGEFNVENGLAEDAVIKLRTDVGDERFLYIRSGDTLSLRDMRDGEYYLLFASGAKWDPSELSFEEDAKYWRFDEPFEFSHEGDGATIWDVRLGNMEDGMHTIAPSEFKGEVHEDPSTRRSGVT